MPAELSDTYRTNAARERELAAATTLPQTVLVHLRSAERWEQLAARVENAREP